MGGAPGKRSHGVIGALALCKDPADPVAQTNVVAAYAHAAIIGHQPGRADQLTRRCRPSRAAVTYGAKQLPGGVAGLVRSQQYKGRCEFGLASTTRRRVGAARCGWLAGGRIIAGR